MRKALLTLFLALLNVVASWAHDVEVDGIYYNLNRNDNTATVTYEQIHPHIISSSYSGDVVIPDEISVDGVTFAVTSIARDAFCGCTDLTSVVIGNSVKTIAFWAFIDCTGLKSVTIGKSVESISSDAFENCNNVEELIYADGCTHTIGTDLSSVHSVTIPNTVTRIDERAFLYFMNLSSIIIPNSVISIGENAFYRCISLPVIDNLRYADTYLVEAVDKNCTSANIKEGTRWIGTEAFSGCSSLTYVPIPNSVISIGKSAFGGCTSLQDVTFPTSVTEIEEYAFQGCTSLPVVNNLRYADTYLVEAVDKNCTSAIIKEGTKWIGTEAFHYCNKLESAIIPNSVLSIDRIAFYMCSSLTSLTIPNSVTRIGTSCFEYCGKLMDITVEWEEPLFLDEWSWVFSAVPVNTATLHVPAGTADKYRAAEVWKDFGNIEEYDDPTGIKQIENDAQNVLNGKYLKNGRVVIMKAGKEYTLDGKKID